MTTGTFLPDLVAELQVPEAGTLSRVLYADDDVRLVGFAFDEGQELTEHSSALAVIVQVVRGRLAMRLGELERVKYTSIKPPHAWSGTPAEKDFDLPAIKEPTVIFRGKPADAGRLYPKNANLAVTVALCGAGLDRTEIELVADPTLPPGTNASRLEVVADSGELKLERLGRAMPDNPKTGVLTALTMADDLMKMVRSSDW